MTGMGGMQPMTGMGGMQPMTGIGGMQPMTGMGGRSSMESQAALLNSFVNAPPRLSTEPPPAAPAPIHQGLQQPANEASNLELIKALTEEVARLRGMLENKLNAEEAARQHPQM